MELLVITKNDCRYCGMVKSYLNNEQVEYKTINVSEQPEYIKKYDVMGTPTILLLEDEEVIAKTTGFDSETLNTFIEQL